ncbi:hypothetical protein EVAR_87397_1 [Eumeta japonica]|uniref:Uncharacterized protein n=1 Tax=Eumeta variegata TaxID=151549 RepID=A0A4C1Y3K5_EUMVA|nr:hypothetical protein EVAR_87397_1 [Eumeta japonica]
MYITDRAHAVGALSGPSFGCVGATHYAAGAGSHRNLDRQNDNLRTLCVYRGAKVSSEMLTHIPLALLVLVQTRCRLDKSVQAASVTFPSIPLITNYKFLP